MGSANWNVAFTIVAGADLSARQYRAVNESGVLSTSATNGVGILQNKPQLGEHGTVVKLGVTKAYVGGAVSPGTFVGYSGATSGFLAAVTSGGIACGRSTSTTASGGLASVFMFGGLSYIAL